MEYKQVAIPKPIVEEIEKIMPILGYRSFSEFVIEAVRRFLPQAQYMADRRLEQLAKKETESVEF